MTKPQSNNAERYDTVSHNFEAMNRAIDTQVDKQLELSSLYEFQQTSRRTQVIMHITISLCFLALTATAIWWLLSSSGHIVAGNISYADRIESKAVDRKTIDALKVISKSQTPVNNADQAFINTSFTVFHRTLISTGEYVVTGKTYQPSDLNRPYEQYCYLEQNQNSQQLSGQALSYIENGELVLETEDKAMIELAKRYCQFSR
jgi:hypothetical protein